MTATLGHQGGGKADELQTVAKALLGPEQNGRAIEGRAIPHGGWEMRDSVAAELEASLILAEASAIFTGGKQAEGVIKMYFGIVRGNFESALKCLPGFTVTRQGGQCTS